MKWHLFMKNGFFPEVLPPCFVSSDFRRAAHGIIGNLKNKKFHKGRQTNYIKYNGTKHDGNRRTYGTPNPISYFHICGFVADNWKTFENNFKQSPFTVSYPKAASDTDDRAIIVSSLSELSHQLSKKIKYAPYILKADVAQFFPSIYTHSIPWAAHGIDASKADQNYKSIKNRFNRLDFFVQNIQSKQTRGVLVGPDAFRVIAEFIACQIDKKLLDVAGKLIVGAVRHVDDFYIGVRSETDAVAVLSHLREVLQTFELQVNDSKTDILNGLTPIDDVWAQDLRSMPVPQFHFFSADMDDYIGDGDKDKVNRLLDHAFELSQKNKSESPIKMALRRLDQAKIYRTASWKFVEPKLQRMLFHFPHSLDYISLLVVKRFAIDQEIDREGWKEAAEQLIGQHLSFRHHHEIVWLLWLLLTCEIEISPHLITKLSSIPNGHIQSLLIKGFVDQRIDVRPDISLGSKLSSTDENWLVNLVSRSIGFTKASFGAALNQEFEHLADNSIELIDFDEHVRNVHERNTSAISRTRYGYDGDPDEEEKEEEEDGDDYGYSWLGDDD